AILGVRQSRGLRGVRERLGFRVRDQAAGPDGRERRARLGRSFLDQGGGARVWPRDPGGEDWRRGTVPRRGETGGGGVLPPGGLRRRGRRPDAPRAGS